MFLNQSSCRPLLLEGSKTRSFFWERSLEQPSKAMRGRYGLQIPRFLRPNQRAYNLPSVAPAWPCFTYLAFCHGPCVAFRGPTWPCFTYFASCHGPCVTVTPAWPCFACLRGARGALLPVLAPAWPSVGPVWPCFAYFASCHAWPSVAAAWPYFAHFASCLGPCVSFHGRRMALLRLLCFLSWPLRGIPWPPRGLASPTLLPVAWPCFAYFASCHAWLSVTAAWPCFAYFASCHPCVAFRGRSVALRCPLCLLSWPPRVALLRLITLLPVLAPVWASVAAAWPDFAAAWTYFAHFFACCLGPCVALCGPACPCFAYFASCHGPCVAFRGRRVALLCSRCFLSWRLRGLPWPPRGLTLPTLLPVLAPAWPSVAAAWSYFAHAASCLGPCVAFRGRRLALLCSLCPCLDSGVAFSAPRVALRGRRVALLCSLVLALA